MTSAADAACVSQSYYGKVRKVLGVCRFYGRITVFIIYSSTTQVLIVVDVIAHKLCACCLLCWNIQAQLLACQRYYSTDVTLVETRCLKYATR